MSSPDNDIVERLAEALRHHQKNLVERKKAEDKDERLHQATAQLQELTGGTETEKD